MLGTFHFFLVSNVTGVPINLYRVLENEVAGQGRYQENFPFKAGVRDSIICHSYSCPTAHTATPGYKGS